MMLSRYALFIFIVLLSCANKTYEGGNLSLRGFYSSPNEIIDALKGKDGYREQFMLGQAYKEKKEYKTAIFHFANCCFTTFRAQKIKIYPQPIYKFITGFHIKSEFYDSAAYEIAGLFYLYREFEYTVRFADLVSKKEKALYRDAVVLKSQALASLKRHDEARAALSEIMDKYEDLDSRALFHIRLASIHEKSGQLKDSVKEYLNVIRTDEKSWQAKTAADELFILLPKSGMTLNGEENLIFAKGLFYSGRYAQALESLNRISSSGQEKKILLARIRVRMNDVMSAMQIAESPDGNRQARAELLKTVADELWSMKRRYDAIQHYTAAAKLAIEPFSQKSLKRAAVFLEERKIAGYEGYLLDYKNRYPNDSSSAYFLWLLARNSIAANNIAGARTYCEESLEKYPASASSDRCRFWLYKIYTSAGDTQGAFKMLKSMAAVNPDSSYTWLLLKNVRARFTEDMLNKGWEQSVKKRDRDEMALYHTLLFLSEKSISKRNRRLGDFQSSDVEPYKKFDSQIRNMKVSSKYSGQFTLIEKYFEIGYSPGIMREIGIIPADEKLNEEKYIALAHLAKKHKNFFISVHSGLELLKLKKMKENILFLQDESLQTLYPHAFSDCVKSSSVKYEIEPEMIYSVMKAESLFNHRAVSSAGAEGLMQLMPDTAAGIARDLNMREFDMKDPCVSVLFGVKYISWLKKYYRGDFELMLAGYNAGAGNVNKWKERFADRDKDYFIEFIPFAETRNYLLRAGKYSLHYSLLRVH